MGTICSTFELHPHEPSILELGEERTMPEDHEHVIDAAEHAAEVGSKSSQLPALLLAGAAFLASLGAFLKTFDHSTTEGTYKTTSDLIVKLSERQQKTDEQVA